MEEQEKLVVYGCVLTLSERRKHYLLQPDSVSV